MKRDGKSGKLRIVVVKSANDVARIGTIKNNRMVRKILCLSYVTVDLPLVCISVDPHVNDLHRSGAFASFLVANLQSMCTVYKQHWNSINCALSLMWRR
jgi:hypothetical protein